MLSALARELLLLRCLVAASTPCTRIRNHPASKPPPPLYPQNLGLILY